MVTVLLSGGLGNQMFQYAAARALATRLDTSLYLDLYSLEKKTQATVRSFELEVFNIDAEIKNSIRGKILNKILPYAQKHRIFFLRLNYFTDTAAIFYQPSFENLKGNIMMAGSFQNEQYFRNIMTELRSEFTFRKPLTGKNLEISEAIAKSNAVSIHIRRGDYLTNKSAAANFITCDKDYYDKAIEHINRKVENVHFYIFSEDFEWIKENLNFGDQPVTFIDWNKGQESYIDMQLMSLCRHNIIANSSFSWWGAWLNSNVDKIVVAPSRWFRSKDKNALLDKFYPAGWTKI